MPYKLISAVSLIFFACQLAFAQYNPKTSSQILHGIKKANTVGSVLYVAAHPDDENTRLLSWLANERMMRTGYISLTRGDGGQNLIGAEKGPLLGLIRTQELLEARKIDGAEQFFTRANDFGYSKGPEETLEIWDSEGVLADMVWVIRNFKPDIIINRFPTTGEGGHGHHTAASILAIEAFDAAADPNRFPEQLQYVEPWQAKRILWNAFVRDPNADLTRFMKIDIGKHNPLLGKSYGEMAADSRSMHKSQGFGTARTRGSIPEYFLLEKGQHITNDVFDGIETSWNRINGGKRVSNHLDRAIKNFDPANPSAIVPSLIQAYNEVQKINNPYWKAQKSKELIDLIIAASGLHFEAVSNTYYSSHGENITLTASLVNQGNVPVSLNEIHWPNGNKSRLNRAAGKNELLTFREEIKVPAEADFSDPYWLRETGTPGMYTVNNQQLIGNPENDPSLEVGFDITIGGQKFSVNRTVAFKWTDPVDGETYRPFEILPPVTVNLNENVYLFTHQNPSLEISANLYSNKNNASGTLEFEAPEGWRIEPTSVPFSINNKGDAHLLRVRLLPVSENPTGGKIKAFVNINGERHSRQVTRIDYGHIPNQVLLPEASSQILPMRLDKTPGKIGYILGAGDDVPKSLIQLGYHVDLLSNYQLENQDLSEYDAILVGIRAYNTNERMRFAYRNLMEYVNGGGNMIVQYSANNRISPIHSEIGPFKFNISRDRVTDHTAEVTFDQEHPALNYPFKITTEDFEGWVQERGLYFADEWEPVFQTPLQMADPGEDPSKGSLLIAPYGEGHFVYTGLSFFRQLPAGVPGAYRLFINLISL